MGKTTLQWLARLGTGVFYAAIAAVILAFQNPDIAAGPGGDPVLGPALGGFVAFVANLISNALANLAGPKPLPPSAE